MITAESNIGSNAVFAVEPTLKPEMASTPLGQERGHYETRLFRALQNAYGATRDRLAETLEQDDALPALFWKREEQILLTLLEPLIVEGLRMGMWAAGMDVPPRKLKLKARLLRVGRARTEELARQIMDRQRGWTATLVTAWLEKGEPVGALRRRLWAGPFNESYLHALVITETTRLIAAGQLLVWNAERADKGSVGRVIVAKRWRSGCDDTCATCRPLDGKAVPLGSPFASGLFAPPAHPRCRCVMEPVWSDDSAAEDTEPSNRRVTALLPAVTP